MHAVAESQYLNIFATGDQSNYSIFFSPGSVALPFNDPTLQNINAELAIQKKTYPNASDAQAQVAVSQSTASLPCQPLLARLNCHRRLSWTHLARFLRI